MTSTNWQLARDAAERQERVLVPAILGPFARALIDRSDLRQGDVVVDIGCGTGTTTRLAAERVGPKGRVIGVDADVGMITIAASILPRPGSAPIEWREASADDLGLDAGFADAIVCAQTLQFLPDPAAALAEAERVLGPGGRLALSVWCPIEASPYFRALVDAVGRHIGADVARGLAAAFTLTDVERIRELVAAAGFVDVEATIAKLELRLPPLSEFVPRHIAATPLGEDWARASEAARAAVVSDVACELAACDSPAGARIAAQSHLVTATKSSNLARR